MKVCAQWLREMYAPEDHRADDTADMAERLTLAGLEVKDISTMRPQFSGVVTAQLLSVRPHPDASNLSLCSVDAGGAQPLSVVCGAPGLVVNEYYPLATIGAVLPTAGGGAIKVEERTIRGQTSGGMLCSEAELGLNPAASDGLWALGSGLRPGQDLIQALKLSGAEVLHFDLTPNRGDCFSLLGLAREYVALAGAEKPLDLSSLPTDVQTDKSLSPWPTALSDVAQRSMCRALHTRHLVGLRTHRQGAATPWWIKERLRRADIRAISPAVDVSNYVMLETGQPLHAFDASKLKPGLQVQAGRSGQSLRLLNGRQIDLSDQDILIADGEGNPLSLAGIMGGEESAVGPDTDEIVIEVAHFYPEAILARAAALQISTDASQRFERGVDPQLPALVVDRAAHLIQSICGGQSSLPNAVGAVPLAAPVAANPKRMMRALGLGKPQAEQMQPRITKGLHALGFQEKKQKSDSPKDVASKRCYQPPSWRFDCIQPADIQEEIARLIGYDNIPLRLPRIANQPEGMRAAVPSGMLRSWKTSLRTRLSALGWHECINYSFVPDDAYAQVSADLRLQNPMTQHQTVMRAGLLWKLAQNARHNVAHRQANLRLYEVGVCFEFPSKSTASSSQQLADSRPVWEQFGEYTHFAGVVAGPPRPKHPDDKDAPSCWKLSDLSAQLSSCLQVQIEALEQETSPDFHAWGLDPARSLSLSVASQPGHRHKLSGTMGYFSKKVCEENDLPVETLAFELRLQSVPNDRDSQDDLASGLDLRSYAPFPRFPLVQRDLAFIMVDSRSWPEVEACLRAVAGDELVALYPFDRFAGKDLSSGEVSLAVTLCWQPQTQTWDAAQIQERVDAVVAAAEKGLGAHLRAH